MSTLPIAWTWDGHALPTAERAAVQLADDGDLLLLRVLAPEAGAPPPEAPPGPTPRLWEHEVVELFVAGEGPAYLEVEVGPHGHHLVIRLSGVRQWEASALPLDLRTLRAPGRAWAADARIPRAWLPPGPHRVAAFRMRPGGDPPWLVSVPLPGPRPDFHQPHRFPPLPLPAPGPAHREAALRALLRAVRPEAVGLDDAVAAALAAHPHDDLAARLAALDALDAGGGANRSRTG